VVHKRVPLSPSSIICQWAKPELDGWKVIASLALAESNESQQPVARFTKKILGQT